MARPKGSKTKKANPGNPNNRFSLTERERLKLQVQRLDAQGYSEYQIAAELGNVSRSTVHNLIGEVLADYQQAYVDNRRMWTMRELAVVMDVRKRAYEEIARLKEHGKRKKVNKSGTKGEGGAYDEEAETVEDPELLGWHKLLLETQQEVKELLGLKDLPAQVFMQINNAVNAPDVFDQLYERLKFAADPQAIADLAAAPSADTIPDAEAGG